MFFFGVHDSTHSQLLVRNGPRPRLWGWGAGGGREQGHMGAAPFPGFLEDPERKYHFECCSEEQCQQWMAALRQARWGADRT